jgi:two-component system, chemotaxis family, sensor kinase Cph1
LEAVLAKAGQVPADGNDEVVRAILNNASLAAMDIAEARTGPPAAPLLHEIEESIRRSTALYDLVRRFSR